MVYLMFFETRNSATIDVFADNYGDRHGCDARRL